LFNQPHSARAATPWQPNAGIANKLSSRGYATTSWSSDEPENFADLGYPAKASGFSAAHYQPTKQPLSQQAKASLALLEGEYRNEHFGEAKPAPVEGTETNEHLPFVMDAYGASRKSKLRVNVDPAVLQRAMAQAELAETLVVSPITTDDKVADPIVIHPDVPDVQTLETVAEKPQAIRAEDTSAEPVNDSAQAAEATQTAAVEQPAEPALPAVVGGIAPEEVAQREAEQFAKGLAQAREEAAAQLAEAVRVATEEAMAKGLEEGLAKGKAEGLAEGLEQGLAKGTEEGKAAGLEQGKAEGLEAGKEQGLAEGEAKARAEVADEMAAQRVVFENVATELGALIADPKKFFEPLKRLAMHMAEQVVVGELQTSSKGIERLVQRCLDELDHPVHGAVVLELNPEDKELLQAQGGDFIKGMRLEAVHEMQRGSVRVFANDTVVEDLVDHRLEGLAKALLIDVDAWREKSPLAQRILEVQQEEAEDDDVHS
jgi:flagellar biosynthesis/type III secretory pathway protein FliH